MVKNILKRTYNFTPELLAEWKSFHGSSTKDFSASAGAAFLLYMVVEPALREKLRKLAYENDIKKARVEARKALRQIIIDGYWSGFVGNMSELDTLRDIEHHLRPPQPPEPHPQPISPPDPLPLLTPCDACKRYFKTTSLVKIAIGKTVCPACKKFIESKKS